MNIKMPHGTKNLKHVYESIINAQNAGDVAKVEELKEAWRQERFARAFELYFTKRNCTK